MRKLVVVCNWITFCAAVILVGALCWQGMDGGMLPRVVAAAVGVMDLGFLGTTLLRLFVIRPRGVRLALAAFSALLLAAAVVMKAAGCSFAVGSLLFWDLFVLLYSGFLICRGEETA